MKSLSEYDIRQLKLMLQALTSFENNQIELDSLVGTLEFLQSALDTCKEEWSENFSNEVATLEFINAIEINNENGEEYYEITPAEKEKQITEATLNLKHLIEGQLNK